MNRKLKKKNAIQIILLCYAAVLILLIGPLKILDGHKVIKGNEIYVAPIESLWGESLVQQVFKGDGGYLESIDLYAVEDASREVYQFAIYDEEDNKLFDRYVAFERHEVPGFIRLPLGIWTEKGKTYCWRATGTENGVRLGFENTAESGLTVNGNYTHNGMEWQGNNIISRYTYAKPAPFWLCAGLIAAIAALTAAAVFYVQGAKENYRFRGEVSVQWTLRRIFNPLIGIAAAALLIAVFPIDMFGGTPVDKTVYALGIMIAAATAFYAVNSPRMGYERLFHMQEDAMQEHVMDFLQTVCFAGVFWGCMDYMNAMYNIFQAYAYRKVLIFGGLLLLTMCARKLVFRWTNLIWTAAAGIAGYLYYLPHRGEAETGKLVALNCWIFVIAGLVLIQLLYKILRKEIRTKRINKRYALLLTAFFTMLVLFRNGRGWPVYLVVYFLLFYTFYVGWRHRGRLLANFCNGIILNFICASVFCMLRRPFRAWYFYRYNFTFHTVTVTAAYLTLVFCALLVKFLAAYRRGKKPADYIGTAVCLGMAGSFLLLTLSRTGYLAAAVTTVVVTCYVSFVCYREKFGFFCKKAGILLLIQILALPAVYSSIRIIPALYNDPYIFEVEDSEWAVHKEDVRDSENYMTIDRLIYCVDDKLFPGVSKEEAENRADEARAVLTAIDGRVRVNSSEVLVASADDAPDGSAADFSNGRLDIFRSYIKEWNLTGHEDMGVNLPNGELSIHAHNTYLQVIHDHGLLTGAVYLLLGVLSIIQMLIYAAKRVEKDAYAALPLSVFTAYAVAGLVEWLFHPCNPMGFAVMVILAPILCFKNKQGKKK